MQVEVTRTTIAHPFPLRDVYSESDAPLPFTRRVPTLSSTIDFIWASRQLTIDAVSTGSAQHDLRYQADTCTCAHTRVGMGRP